MSREIYFCSEDKKYKCAVKLADSCDRFGCPDHSVIILTEERPNGTYIIAEARCRILETEKDKQIADLQHKLEVAEKALELACEEINRVEAKFGSAYIRANGYLVDYFKTEAKEMMKSE